jgi:hypothetical protein
MGNGFNNRVDFYYRTTGHDRRDIHCDGGNERGALQHVGHDGHGGAAMDFRPHQRE